MSEPFIGEVRIWACNFAPRNWAFCNGTLIQVDQNPALFSIVGSIYGGNGRTDFGLPNLQGRSPMHAGNGPGLTQRAVGAQGGFETVTLSEANMPAHSHTVNAHLNDSEELPGGNYISDAVFEASSNATMATDSIGLTGSGTAMDIMQPFLALNFCIALDGVFPSR